MDSYSSLSKSIPETWKSGLRMEMVEMTALCASSEGQPGSDNRVGEGVNPARRYSTFQPQTEQSRFFEGKLISNLKSTTTVNN